MKLRRTLHIPPIVKVAVTVPGRVMMPVVGFVAVA
jgi:hypothetical protein